MLTCSVVPGGNRTSKPPANCSGKCPALSIKCRQPAKSGQVSDLGAGRADEPDVSGHAGANPELRGKSLALSCFFHAAHVLERVGTAVGDPGRVFLRSHLTSPHQRCKHKHPKTCTTQAPAAECSRSGQRHPWPQLRPRRISDIGMSLQPPDLLLRLSCVSHSQCRRSLAPLASSLRLLEQP